MTPACIVLVASLLTLVTPAIAATTAVPGICDQTLKALSFAAAAKHRVVGCDCALERDTILDLAWPQTGKRFADWHAAVQLIRNKAANSSTPS
ncbi:MAG TPA: hypothetical protein VLL28_07915 [Hyphomicrobiaceae bacterium]|nr:hypothetical protein [Hyphomicrobiaceae bacterium]